MGTIRSKTYVPPVEIAGITLGTPVVLTREDGQMRPQQPGDSLTDAWFVWDDAAIPSGTLNDDGTVTPDAE